MVDGSAITPAVAAANFRSFGAGFADPEAERLALLAERFAQLNPQAGHSYVARMKLQWRYGHLDAGGWRFVGDALPGHQPTPRWKPSAPRLDGKGRPIKYEAQPGRRPGLLLPQVPAPVWRLICERHGLPFPADRSGGFWAWALATPALPLVVAEGEKKACALLGLGLAAVGLPGVEMGRVVERDALGEPTSEALAPGLELLAPGRAITITFDADAKPSTAAKVERAAVRLGHLLAKAGATVRIARVPLLWGEAKTGPDDLLVALGADALLEALADGLALAEVAWERRYRAERRILHTIDINGWRIPAALALPAEPLVGVRSPKGSGKTQTLERWLAERPQVLAITHRRSLGATLANRLGLVWRNDCDSAEGRTFDAEGNCWDGLPPRYALCIDSLLAIRPETFAGCVLVLDEAEQVLAHLLTSATCREQRGLLIQRLQQLVAAAGQTIALDADLSDATLAWLQQARRSAGRPDELALLVGQGSSQGWPVRWYEQGRPDEAQAALLEAAARGPVFVTTDSRERAAAIHALLEHHLPQAKGLLITSETTGQAEVQAWIRKLPNLQALAAGAIRWVVASPSISSGLSVEHAFFREVFAFFGAGSFDDAEALQALARVRPPVPRHVWVAPVVRPAQQPLTSAWWPQAVERDLRRRWDGQTALLRQQLQPDLLLEPNPGAAADQFAATIKLWADFTSRRNYAISHLRAFIKARLRAEGHTLVAATTELPDAEAQALKTLKDQLRGERQQAHAEAVANAPIITKAEAERLRRLQQHSPALQRRALVERLALEPEALTPALVVWGERWAGAALRLACLLEPGLAARLDQQRLQATTPEGQAPLPWDQTYRVGHRHAAETLGLRAFIEAFPFRCRLWSKDTPELQALAQRARDNRERVELALGIKVRANDSDVSLVNTLLASFGITATSKRQGSTSRMYGADADQLRAIRSAADRLRQRGSGQAPPTADKGAVANKTACGGAPQPEPPEPPCAGGASWAQLPLAVAISGHGSAQRAGGASASEAPAEGRQGSPPNPWRPCHPGIGATASSP